MALIARSRVFCLVLPRASRAQNRTAVAVGLGAATVGALLAPPSPARPGGNYFLPVRSPQLLPTLCEAVASPPASTEATAAASGSVSPEVVEVLPPVASLQHSIVRLYQYESCPFCRKVRSCLDYNDVPYEIVEVNPLTKAESKQVASDYKKVPILRVDMENGRQLQLRDSKTIVLALLGSSNPGVAAKVPPPWSTPATGNMWPSDSEQSDSGVEAQWIRWTDKVLVQCIVLNVYRTIGESAETFNYLLTHPSFNWFAQRSAALTGTVLMWGVSKARRRRFAVADERAALYEAADTFALAVQRGGGPFLGGERPGAADFNTYGVLRSAEGCLTERDLMEQCPAILPWYSSMRKAVGPTRATNASSVQRGDGGGGH